MIGDVAGLPDDLQDAILAYQKVSTEQTSSRLISRVSDYLHHASGRNQRYGPNDYTSKVLLWLHGFLLASDVARDEEILSMMPFDLFPALAGHFGRTRQGLRQDDAEEQQEIRTFAIHCAEAMVAKTSSPRELVLAIMQQFDMLKRTHSDGNSSDSVSDEENDESDCFLRVSVLMRLHLRALQRVQKARIASSIRHLADALLDLPQISETGDTIRLDKLDCLAQLAESIKSLAMGTSDTAVKAALTSLLYSGVAVFHAPQGLATESARQRYSHLVSENTHTLDRSSDYSLVAYAYASLLDCIKVLSLDALEVFDDACSDMRNDDKNATGGDASQYKKALQQFGAFVLAVQSYFGTCAVSTSLCQLKPSLRLSKAMPMIILAFQGFASGAFTDEALYWCLSSIPQLHKRDQQKCTSPKGPAKSDEDDVDYWLLLTLASDLALRSPKPSLRFNAWLLVSNIVLDAFHADEQSQLMALKQLILEEDAASLRAQSMSLLRDLLADRSVGSNSDGKSIIMSTMLMEEVVVPAVCRPLNTSDARTFLEEEGEYTMQALSLLQLLFSERFSTKLRMDVYAEIIKTKFLTPLRVRLQGWTANGDDDPQLSLQFGLMSLALDRLLTVSGSLEEFKKIYANRYHMMHMVHQ